MMKNSILLCGMVLSLSLFNTHAKSLSTDTREVVKKYFVGKPGYNRRVVKVHQSDIFDKINYQIASDAPAAGLLLS